MILLSSCNLVHCQHNHPLGSLFKTLVIELIINNLVAFIKHLLSAKYKISTVTQDNITEKIMYFAKVFIKKNRACSLY